MVEYKWEGIRVDGGDISIVELTAMDDDLTITSEEVGVEYTVNGVSQGPDAPTLESGRLTVVQKDGAGTEDRFVVRFLADDGAEIFWMTTYDSPNDIESVGAYSLFGTIGGFSNINRSLIDSDASPFYGEALEIEDEDPSDGFDPDLTDLEVKGITFWDDDGMFEFAGDGDGTASETDDIPQGMDDNRGMRFDVDTYNDSTTIFGAATIADAANLAIADIGYDDDGDGGEDGVFSAAILSVSFGGDIHTYILPHIAEGIDLASLDEITSAVVTSDLDGASYADYGLNGDLVAQVGTSGADVLKGDWKNDEFTGDAGDDALYGSFGDDIFFGGAGDDAAYGGDDADEIHGDGGADMLFGGIDDDALYGDAGADEVQGGRGDDRLYGGAGDDVLKGGDGADKLFGGNGDDLLVGGAGGDRLDGGDGADKIKGDAKKDVLIDGDGKDILRGAGGADRFEIGTDAFLDQIKDFEDGSDKVQLTGVVFADLNLTDLGGGIVKVNYDGDKLWLRDNGDELLTAADITADDFIFV